MWQWARFNEKTGNQQNQQKCSGGTGSINQQRDPDILPFDVYVKFNYYKNQKSVQSTNKIKL